MVSILFPAGVLGFAVTMLLAHARNWRRAKSRLTSDAERLFRHHQFWRRMQTSSLLALVAPTMLVGLRVSPERSPRLFVILWLLVILTTCWIGWLAILDAVASSRYFRRLSQERAAARAHLKREFEQILAATREGGAGPITTDLASSPQQTAHETRNS